MVNEQPEALFSADRLEMDGWIDAATALRRLHAENEALKDQRDALLEAMRRIADTSANESGAGSPWVHWVDQARAAIAKAGGAA